MGSRIWTPVLALLACACALSGCGGMSTSTAGEEHDPQRHGGSIVVGFDQEPAVLNTKHIQGAMSVGVMITDPMLDEWIYVDEDNTYRPRLLTDVPTVESGHVRTVGGTMVVSADIRPEAHWSDGVPVTCDDMKFTVKMIMDDHNLVGSRLGWGDIEKVDCPTPKRMVLTFMHPYAPYLQHIFASSPYPAHEWLGKDFNTYWNDRYTVTSGPFRFDHWKRGVEIAIKRDPNYWNSENDDLPWLDRITFRFIKDTNTLKIQLRTGEVDLINPPPDSSLAEELKTFPRSDFQSEPGGFWEHIALYQGKPPLNDVNVRSAILYSIDRTQITDTVLKKQVDPLNSTLLPSVKEYYVPAWERYHHDPKKVARYLEKAGYERSSGYWEKGGEPLTLLFKSTAGNVLRMKVAQLLQQQLKSSGIRMTIQLEEPSVFFGQSTPSGAYQLGVWAWSSALDPTQTSLFACDQIPSDANNHEGSNYYHYCNDEVSHLLHQSDVTADPSVRSKLVARIQELMADDAVLLPLYQRPDTVAYSKRMQGIVDNPIGGTTWNTEHWSVVMPS